MCKNLSTEKKKRNYKVYLQFILLYGCATRGMSKARKEQLGAFQRKLSRRVHGIFYPEVMSSEACSPEIGKLGREVKKWDSKPRPCGKGKPPCFYVEIKKLLIQKRGRGRPRWRTRQDGSK